MNRSRLFPGLCLIFTILLPCSIVGDEDTWKLLQVQFISRHGDRTPCHTFPNDIYANMWPMGLEQLTPLGAIQLQEMGRYLRHRYETFLPAQYHKDLVYIRSTDTERTLLSAQHCVSTLFHSVQHVPQQQLHRLPPNMQASAPTSFTIQTPVHSVPKKYDTLLKISAPCPEFKRQLASFFASPEFKKLSAPFHALQEHLVDASGIQETSKERSMSEVERKARRIKKSWDVCDPVLVWSYHNLSLPTWLNDSLVAQCRQWLHFKHTITYHHEWARRLRGGPIVRHVLTNFRTRAYGSSPRLLWGYFAHDSTIAALLSRLGMHNKLTPPVAAALLMELYQRQPVTEFTDQGENFGVRFLYRNESQGQDAPLYILVPHFCQALTPTNFGSDEVPAGLCSLAALENAMEPLLPLDERAECGLDTCPTSEQVLTTPPQVSATCSYITIIGLQSVALFYILYRIRA